MRTILFRGKRVDNGEWVLGDYIQHNGAIKIYDRNGTFHEVTPESVGQFIEEVDLNESKIFEGDIIQVCVFMVSPQNCDDDHHFIGEVYFDGCWMITIHKQMSRHTDGKWTALNFKGGLPTELIGEDGTIEMPLHELCAISSNLGLYNSENIEIIGNIHDTPESLNP